MRGTLAPSGIAGLAGLFTDLLAAADILEWSDRHAQVAALRERRTARFVDGNYRNPGGL